MKVKCIDISDSIAGNEAHNYLVLGQIYEVERGGGPGVFLYSLVGVEYMWGAKAFQVVDDSACEQCGTVHP